MAMMRTSVVLLIAGVAACDLAEPVQFALSVQFADGRSCRDTGATTISVTSVHHGATSFVCHDAERPSSLDVTDAPRTGEVQALSPDGAVLYRSDYSAQGARFLVTLYAR